MAKAKNWKSTRKIPEGKTQVNFNIDNGTLKKVTFISKKETGKERKNSEIYNKSVEAYVERWEKRNGKIKEI